MFGYIKSPKSTEEALNIARSCPGFSCGIIANNDKFAHTGSSESLSGASISMLSHILESLSDEDEKNKLKEIIAELLNMNCPKKPSACKKKAPAKRKSKK